MRSTAMLLHWKLLYSVLLLALTGYNSQSSVSAATVTISGPDRILVNRKSTFSCSTSCTVGVDCTISWQFKEGYPRGIDVSVNDNVLTLTPTTTGTILNFNCVVKNVKSGRTAEGSKRVEVVENESALSGSEMVRLSGVFTQILSLGLLFLFNS